MAAKNISEEHNIRMVSKCFNADWVGKIALDAIINGNGTLPEDLADVFTLTHIGTDASSDGVDVWILDFADD